MALYSVGGRARDRHATVAAAQVSSQLALLSALQSWHLSELSFGSCFVPVYYLRSDLLGSIREKSVFGPEIILLRYFF